MKYQILFSALFLAGCGNSVPVEEVGETFHANTVDETAFSNLKKTSDSIINSDTWNTFNCASKPIYLVRTDNKGNPEAGFVINPKSRISGARKLGKNESSGLNVWRYDGAIQLAKDKIGGNLYAFNFIVDGKSYYTQTYNESNTMTNSAFSNSNKLLCHEVFHGLHQHKLIHPSYSKQPLDSNGNIVYPTTRQLLELQILYLDLFEGLPKSVTKSQAIDMLKQYVAIRSTEISIDPYVRRANYQEWSEGTAQFVETMGNMHMFKDKSKNVFMYFPNPHGLHVTLHTQSQVASHFGWNVFYGSGASVIWLLKQAGFDYVKAIEEGKTPYEAAKVVTQFKDSEISIYLGKAKRTHNWKRIQETARKLSEKK
ncbi:hypothetical protein [Vibrio nigripulchritudo]|uniref:hypothetical protein n=1 Tax=Vibrio nigripulchritudo TaxID=28173 RepID=UPI0012DAA3C6|nr:hypothetical protein [Vibrio nigripulchritudo]